MATAYKRLQTIGAPHPERVRWPLTRREARAGLAHFIEHALPWFGPFQDAMSTRSTTLFHSGLSFALNVKLLHPREVIDAAVAACNLDKNAALHDTGRHDISCPRPWRGGY